MPAGRPPDYKEEYCEQIEELGRRGKHVYQMALEMNVGVRTLYGWAARYPEFEHSFSRARDFAKGYLINRADNMLTDPDAQPKILELKTSLLSDYVPAHKYRKCSAPKEQLEAVVEEALNGERSGHSARVLCDAIMRRIEAEEKLEVKPLLEKLKAAFEENEDPLNRRT